MTDGSPAFPYPGGRGRLERYEPPLPAVVEDVVLVCAVWVVVEPEELDALALWDHEQPPSPARAGAAAETAKARAVAAITVRILGTPSP